MTSIFPIHVDTITQRTAGTNTELKYVQKPIESYFKVDDHEKKVDDYTVSKQVYGMLYELDSKCNSKNYSMFRTLESKQFFYRDVVAFLLKAGLDVSTFLTEKDLPLSENYQSFIKKVQEWSGPLPKLIPIYEKNSNHPVMIYTPVCTNPDESINPDLQEATAPITWFENKLSKFRYGADIKDIIDILKKVTEGHPTRLNWLLCIYVYNYYAYETTMKSY